MAKASTTAEASDAYRSRRNKLPDIRRKVDALEPKAREATRKLPRDHSIGLRGVTGEAPHKGFQGDLVDPVLNSVHFVEGPTARRRAAATPPAKTAKPAKKAAKKPAAKAKPKRKAVAKKSAKKAAPKRKAAPKKAANPAKKAKPAAKKPAAKASLRPQCAAATPEGKQCRNSARDGSKYCGSHKGFHPSKRSAKAKDTKPRVAKAKDTTPAKRKKARKA